MIASGYEFASSLLCYPSIMNDNNDNDSYYYDDDVDEIEQIDFCNPKIVELTLQRDFLLTKLQEFVDSTTPKQAERAIKAMERETTASNNSNDLTNEKRLLKFLVRAGTYVIIRDAVQSKDRFQIIKEETVGTVDSNKEEEEERNDDVGDGDKTTSTTSTTNTTPPTAPPTVITADTNATAPTTTATTTTRSIYYNTGLSPLIATPLLNKLKYYYDEREKRKENNKRRRKSLLISFW
ncbi:hypothetical protein FRACYDRAFT_250683 [Fragilariopsis cylindrus CCMP1102]|uniref:Uncharacterized protein n=1 Tax=Fragilariopsis cylindrus CCMP1102 TaxID=635003 RepID=A0A1E7EP64_9STRA|nr:hypothetical protein FRACYDRAFT_250683 [Fragilariopsis cylindrus CCMP1102]|eukprot:OEU07665.1 hypothetical protein FRACYDRAFT_250683 [Fragilariopsis cylindrus CCMP1102]